MNAHAATMPAHKDPADAATGRGMTLYLRALRLRCPHCGEGRIKGSWMKMKRTCPVCGLRTERGEEDFFLGAMMFNLVIPEGFLALLLVGLMIATWPDVPWSFIQWGGLALMAAGPFLFYPFSKTLWLAFDLMLHPPSPEELARARGGG